MRQQRMYSLFERFEGKWVRISSVAYPKKEAVYVYQNRLLSGCLSGRKMELRPVAWEPILAPVYEAWPRPVQD